MEPVWQRPFLIPYIHVEKFSNKLDHMIREGILRRRHEGSDRMSLSFCIPKKDQQIRVVTDFRELNKVIKRQPYPIPEIQEVMRKRTEYTYMTKIDLSMIFYCFELDEQSKACTATKHPNGSILEYKQLPMGLKISLDVAQAAMEEILQGLISNKVCVYIDDVRIWTNGPFKEHMWLVNAILEQLSRNGLKTNPLKCKWGVKTTDFLG